MYFLRCLFSIFLVVCLHAFFFFYLNGKYRCIFLKSHTVYRAVNIWQSYKQERDCLVHLARMANTSLKDEESARDNHVLKKSKGTQFNDSTCIY